MNEGGVTMKLRDVGMPPKKESEISREFSHLQRTTEGLHSIINILQQKLEPVRTSKAQTPTIAGEKTPSSLCPLAEAIKKAVIEIERANNRLNSLLREIEL